MGVYFGVRKERPCLETRGEDGVTVRIAVMSLDERKHLPIVELQRAA